MASTQEFVDFVVDQIRPAGLVTARKMFGEYALYAGGKVVALVCDDRLFIKPTDAARTFIGEVVEAPPYPGAKAYFLIEDTIEDGGWMGEVIRITQEALPAPARKNRKKGKR